MRRFLKTIAVSLVLLLACAAFAQSTDQRFSSLGHKMICSCGCNQILLECNHVGCPSSEGMRNELMAAIQRGDSDSAVMATFVAKYGPTILAAPTGEGFDRVAWIMPFAVLLLSFGAAVLIVKSWKRRPLSAEADFGEAAPAAYADRIRQETEL